MGKILLITSIAVTFVAALLSFVTHNKLAAATQASASAQADAQRFKGDVAKVQTELKKAKETLATQASSADQATQQVQSSQAELTKSKAEIDDLTKQNADAQTKITQLTADNQAKSDELAKAKAAPAATPSTNEADLTAQVAEQKARADKLQADMDSAHTELAALKKKEDARIHGEISHGIEGRVLAVNSAWNFVVLSLGDRSGVASNTELLVKRGTQFLGKVRVTSVMPSSSIADIVANSVPQGISIQPGDNVIYQTTDEQQ